MELMIVIVVIGILAAVGIVYFSKSITAAQTAAIKSQNDEIYNFIKLKTQTKCIKYSDKLSLSFEKRGRTFTVPWTARCNSSSGSYNGDLNVLKKMYRVFRYYFQMNPNVQFKNPVSSKVKHRISQGYNPSCPSLADAKNMLPGETCITYESLESHWVSGNACTNKGFNTWLLIVSKLPNDEFYFNCAGKIW